MGVFFKKKKIEFHSVSAQNNLEWLGMIGVSFKKKINSEYAWILLGMTQND